MASAARKIVEFPRRKRRANARLKYGVNELGIVPKPKNNHHYIDLRNDLTRLSVLTKALMKGRAVKKLAEELGLSEGQVNYTLKLAGISLKKQRMGEYDDQSHSVDEQFEYRYRRLAKQMVVERTLK
jgi:hypothetical protein